jgi:hypothetical protein
VALRQSLQVALRFRLQLCEVCGDARASHFYSVAKGRALEQGQVIVIPKQWHVRQAPWQNI